MRMKWKIGLAVLICLVVYLALVCVPYVRQGGVTDKTKNGFSAKEDGYMRMKWKIGLAVLICLVVYLALVCVPYVRQGGVTDKTKNGFSGDELYKETKGPDRAAVLFQNQEALEERLRLISGAEERIVLSTFDFHADNSGKKVLAALYDAAKRGVKVQILTDGTSYFLQTRNNPYFKAVGEHENVTIKAYNPINLLKPTKLMAVQILTDGTSYFLQTRNNPYFKAVGEHENVTIKAYNPINLLKPTKLMARLHDKYLLADDRVYIAGGRNTYDFFLGNETDYVNYDWDILVYNEARTEDSSVYDLMEYSEKMWNLPDSKVMLKGGKRSSKEREKITEAGKELEELYSSVYDLMEYSEKMWNLPDSKVMLKGGKRSSKEREKITEAGKELEELYRQMKEEHADWFVQKDYKESTVETNCIRLLYNPIEASLKEPVLFYQMTELMLQTEEETVFHTPYILCNEYMMERLRQICAANEKVTMMTNSVANNGNPFGAMDYRLHKRKILDTGVQVLEYDDGVSYHGKCFTIGDRLTSAGSFNWDMRSAYLDTELMLVVDSKPLNEIMKKYMATYENTCLEVKDKDTYVLKEGQKPQERSTKQKILHGLLTPFDALIRMATYENTCLEVKDKDTYVLKEGQKPQERSTKQKILHGLLTPFDALIRFLL